MNKTIEVNIKKCLAYRKCIKACPVEAITGEKKVVHVIDGKELDIEKPRFTQRADIGKCILCGLCVRVCDKLIGAS